MRRVLTPRSWRLLGQAGAAAERSVEHVKVPAQQGVQGAAALLRQGRRLSDTPQPLTPCERQPEDLQLNELDTQLAEAADKGGAAGVLKSVEQAGENFSQQNVVSAFDALARAVAQNKEGMSAEQVVQHPAFQALVDMVLQGLRRYRPTLLAEVVRAAGRLGFEQDMLYDEICRHLMGRLDQLAPSDVVALATGLAAIEHAPSKVLFDALAARAKSVDDSEQRRQVADAFTKLGYASPFA